VVVGGQIVDVGSRYHRQNIVTWIPHLAVGALVPKVCAVVLFGIILRKKEIGDLLPLLFVNALK